MKKYPNLSPGKNFRLVQYATAYHPVAPPCADGASYVSQQQSSKRNLFHDAQKGKPSELNTDGW